MSTTRRALKHKRDRRRAETEQLRTARRDTLSILLSRAQRGVLSRDEAALLRTHVEAELAEGDAARASERGQQRAMERHRQRVEAAEAAIVEAEQRAEQAEELQRIAHQTSNEAEQQRAAAEQRLAAQQQMHDGRRRALADALAADPETTWPQLVELARQRDHDARANGADCRAEYERARRLEAALAEVKDRRDAAEQRARHAEQALDRVRRADTLGAAVAAVAEHDGLTPQAAAVHAAFTNAADTARARLDEQARAHAVELAQLERRANGWARHAIEADNRLDRALAAWRSARTRAAKRTAQRDRAEQALATAKEERDRALDLAAARGDALAAHLDRPEAAR